MTFPDLMVVCGVAVLGAGLRALGHAVAQKLSLVCLVATSFLVGYFISGNLWIGVALGLSWAFLPWLELLTRVRGVRLPDDKKLEPSAPPHREEFPTFSELTSEFEEEGFAQLDDLGWTWDEQKQFFRVFAHEKEPVQGAICLIEHRGMAFYYLSISARSKDGRQWTTWNYPFSYSLKIPPHMGVNRLRGDTSIFEMMESHRQFLLQNGIQPDALQKPEEKDFAVGIQHDQQLQIDHNLKAGVLRKNKLGEIHYSWRGLLYLWWQFLRDLVRFS